MKKVLTAILTLLSITVACKSRNEGAIKSSDSVFSVSENKKVAFAQGNLQYQASTKIFHFAEKQNEIIGKANSNISENNSDFIDLFGWGTSGWDSGAKQFLPTSSSTREADYIPGNDSKANLTGEYENADWGWFNKIINGGNEEHIWRVLSSQEWTYLLKGRQNADALYGRAIVDGVLGLIILPDSWTDVENVSFKPKATKFADNTYSSNDWELFENNGAVFLPCAGYRYGKYTYDVEVDVSGDYWSTTPDDKSYAFAFYFDQNEVNPASSFARFRGHAIRLVYDID